MAEKKTPVKGAAQNVDLPVPGVDVATLNLEQSLVDFEIANARVVDLTQRLTSISSDLLSLRAENERYRLQARTLEHEAAVARAELADIRGALAYRVAKGLGDVRAGFRR